MLPSSSLATAVSPSSMAKACSTYFDAIKGAKLVAVYLENKKNVPATLATSSAKNIKDFKDLATAGSNASNCSEGCAQILSNLKKLLDEIKPGQTRFYEVALKALIAAKRNSRMIVMGFKCDAGGS
jgi:hypothetical protein